MIDYQPYIEHLKAEKLKQKQQAVQRRKKALQVARKLARVLKEKYGVQKVYLFGSCVEKEYFHLRSDIDLAVQGLAPEKFLAAYTDMNFGEGELWHEFKVDLVDLERCSENWRKRILEFGKEI